MISFEPERQGIVPMVGETPTPISSHGETSLDDSSISNPFNRGKPPRTADLFRKSNVGNMYFVLFGGIGVI